jgi:hypothetical protein
MPSALMTVLLALLLLTNAAFAADPLPSWNDTAPKKAIIAFVDKVTKESSADFVPPAERIATFDHDGTLWSVIWRGHATANARSDDPTPEGLWVHAWAARYTRRASATRHTAHP